MNPHANKVCPGCPFGLPPGHRIADHPMLPVRHASRANDGGPLCGQHGRVTQPKERVNCPDCRVILNHIRDRYPAHAGYGDWRLTQEQEKRAVRDMVADMHGGADD